MELGTWLLVPDSEKYLETQAAYRRFVINYSPDDLEAIKKFIYRNIDKINLQELIAMIRLNNVFSLHESFDLNYEIGGIFYDLFYQALHSFNSSQAVSRIFLQ
jgi:hypothetical protein